MKTPSRSMPQYIPHRISPGYALLFYSILGLIILWFVYIIWKIPVILGVIAAFAVYGVYFNWRRNQEFKRNADERINENICTFARSFERKEVDTWIIRAVHEELQGYLDFPNGIYPLRAKDRLEEDLKVDFEDVDDLLIMIAQRTGRSIEETEKNPYYDKVKTVGDMVLFMNSQPKLHLTRRRHTGADALVRPRAVIHPQEEDVKIMMNFRKKELQYF
jgi:hypothetical protein